MGCGCQKSIGAVHPILPVIDEGQAGHATRFQRLESSIPRCSPHVDPGVNYLYRRGCAVLFVVTKPFKKVKTLQNDGWNQKILYKMTAWKSIVHQNLFKKISTQWSKQWGGGKNWHDQPKRSKIYQNESTWNRHFKVPAGITLYNRYLGGSYCIGAVWRWWWHTSCAWWVSGRVSDVHVTYA